MLKQQDEIVAMPLGSHRALPEEVECKNLIRKLWDLRRVLDRLPPRLVLGVGNI